MSPPNATQKTNSTSVGIQWPRWMPGNRANTSKGRAIAAPEAKDQVQLSPKALQATKAKAMPKQEQLQAMSGKIVDQSFQRVPENSRPTRHSMNAVVQAQEASPLGANKLTYYDGSPVVVIAFEGTNSFDERRTPAMKALATGLQDQGVDTRQGTFAPAALVDDALCAKRGRAGTWSGLSQGAFELIVKDPKLNKNIQILSFPSEETELLANIKSGKGIDYMELAGDSLLSHAGTSRGIEHAIIRMKKISAEAKAQGKNPKFVIMSHSSGGRSTVKFLERLKQETNPIDGKKYEIPLVISVDPCKEAHEMLKDGSRQVMNKGTEHNMNWLRSKIGFREKKVWPAWAGDETQPGVLYKTSNAERWVNFNQREDVLGLKVGPRLGLRGSKIIGAENIPITGVGEDGHGAINWNQKVLGRIRSELTSMVDSSLE